MADTQTKQAATLVAKPLTATDLEAVIALDCLNSPQSRRGFFESRLKAAIDSPKDYVYVGIYDRETLVGFAMARLVHGEFGQPNARASLDAIGVTRGVQNHGAGHQLLKAVKDILIGKGVGALETQVDWADRTLLGFLGNTGFQLAPRIILGRQTDEIAPVLADLAQQNSNSQEVDHSSPESDDFTALSRDRIPVRSMTEADLAAIIRIDRKHSGKERSVYYRRKLDQALFGSGVRLSLVAEVDGLPVGFIMARVDYGEFGHTMAEAVMYAFAVDPGFQGQRIGRTLMSQLVANLAILRVEQLRTEVAWNDVDLIAFFSASGFTPVQRVCLNCSL